MGTSLAPLFFAFCPAYVYLLLYYYVLEPRCSQKVNPRNPETQKTVIWL